MVVYSELTDEKETLLDDPAQVKCKSGTARKEFPQIVGSQSVCIYALYDRGTYVQSYQTLLDGFVSAT